MATNTAYQSTGHRVRELYRQCLRQNEEENYNINKTYMSLRRMDNPRWTTCAHPIWWMIFPVTSFYLNTFLCCFFKKSHIWTNNTKLGSSVTNNLCPYEEGLCSTVKLLFRFQNTGWLMCAMPKMFLRPSPAPNQDVMNVPFCRGLAKTRHTSRPTQWHTCPISFLIFLVAWVQRHHYMYLAILLL